MQFMPSLLGFMSNSYTYLYILIAVLCACVALFILTRLFLSKRPKIDSSFWEHQKLAKSKVIWLYFTFVSVLVLIWLVALSLFMLIFLAFKPEIYYSFNKNYEFYIYTSIILSCMLVAVIFVAYFIKSFLISRHSIDTLAKTLQATEITDSTKVLNIREKMLLNIIEEMAIASQMPMPRVFAMRDEQGVNAMCSGERFGKVDEKIAIFVTQGALDTFNRDELQGVIGHEFSHAFHQDVALNLKLVSMIFGLTCLVIIGEIMLRSVSRSSIGRSKNNGKGMVAIMLIAVVFLALGYIGSFFAQIIQAAISRQKEFLADASSVQYTRNPNGIKSALSKLITLQKSADSAKSTYIKNPNAKPCAHMFFLSAFSSVFATHPPLKERISRLTQI